MKIAKVAVFDNNVLLLAAFFPPYQKQIELRLIKTREPKIRSANDFIEDNALERRTY